MSTQPEEFTLQTEFSDGVLVVRLAGIFRDTAALSLDGALKPHFESAPPLVVVLLDQVEYISSSGIGTLTRLYGEIRAADGRMAIAGPSVHVRDLLHLAGIDQLVEIIENLAEATDHLKAAESAKEGSA